LIAKDREGEREGERERGRGREGEREREREGRAYHKWQARGWRSFSSKTATSKSEASLAVGLIEVALNSCGDPAGMV